MPALSEEYRVLWTGSREGWNSEFVSLLVGHVASSGLDRYDFARMAHGGARGVDSLVESACVTRHIKTAIWLPDWTQHGKRAGILRNQQMVDEFIPHIGIGLNWNSSPGTRHCVTYMRSKGIPVLSINYDGDPEGKFFPF